MLKSMFGFLLLLSGTSPAAWENIYTTQSGLNVTNLSQVLKCDPNGLRISLNTLPSIELCEWGAVAEWKSHGWRPLKNANSDRTPQKRKQLQNF